MKKKFLEIPSPSLNLTMDSKRILERTFDRKGLDFERWSINEDLNVIKYLKVLKANV